MFALFLFATALTVSAQTCDRACLKTTLDQYLNAVTKHDPSATPLFLGYRQTENRLLNLVNVPRTPTVMVEMQGRG